jgi:PAS domain S-box-containing protein
MFDRDMRYLYASNHWLADYALGDRDLHGRSHYEIFPEIPEEWKAAHRRGLAGEVLRSEGDRFERLDGSVQWERWEIRPWHDVHGHIGGIVIFSEDITANKEAERALAESEERLSLVLHGTQDGFWDWDLLRNTLFYSPRWWSMLGYANDPGETDPQLWRRLIHPDDLDRRLMPLSPPPSQRYGRLRNGVPAAAPGRSLSERRFARDHPARRSRQGGTRRRCQPGHHRKQAWKMPCASRRSFSA